MPNREAIAAARDAARQGSTSINSRTGLTTIQIDFMKELYAREPTANASTLAIIKASHTPRISARMRREMQGGGGVDPADGGEADAAADADAEALRAAREAREAGAAARDAALIERRRGRRKRVTEPASARRLVGGLHLKHGYTMHGERVPSAADSTEERRGAGGGRGGGGGGGGQ